jgi:hypothetical protein
MGERFAVHPDSLAGQAKRGKAGLIVSRLAPFERTSGLKRVVGPVSLFPTTADAGERKGKREL